MATTMESMGRHLVKLRAGGYSSRTHVFAPPAAALRIAESAIAPQITANFDFTELLRRAILQTSHARGSQKFGSEGVATRSRKSFQKDRTLPRIHPQFIRN